MIRGKRESCGVLLSLTLVSGYDKHRKHFVIKIDNYNAR